MSPGVAGLTASVKVRGHHSPNNLNNAALGTDAACSWSR